jgi:hypothetical protein
MTQIMLRKLISPRHKGSSRHASGLVQTGFAVKSSCGRELTAKWDEQVSWIGETIDHEKAIAAPHR